MDPPIASQTASTSSTNTTTKAREICKIELLPSTITNPHYLKRCFKALYEKKELIVPPQVIETILKTTLEFKLEEYSETLQKVMVDLFQYLMIQWPQWPRISTLTESDFLRLYQSFVFYLQSNLRDVILNENRYLRKANEESGVHVKRESSFGIRVGAPTILMNNVAFNLKQNDICLNIVQPMLLPRLKISELLNWPYISVYVEFFDIVFKRRNLHQFNGYLDSECRTASGADNRICYIKKLQNCEDTSVFSYEFLYTYLVELLKHISADKEKHRMSLVLNSIFDQFTLDVKETNLYGCTVATNTAVCYNIGGKRYRRNTTTCNTAEIDKKLIFTQEIIPKVEYTLEAFTAKQDLSFQSKFMNLGRKSYENFNITISCECCNFTATSYDAVEQLHKHMQKHHRKHRSVLCCHCKKAFAVEHLAGNRWKHQC